MKAKEMTNMTAEQLTAQVADLKTQLFNLRFQLATGQLANPKQITEVKRDIARALTVLRQKEQALELERRQPLQCLKKEDFVKPGLALL